MESIILWCLGIIFYLLIGFGFKSSFKDIKEKEDDPLSGIQAIFIILVWPFDFGYLLSQASAYYQAERNTVYGLLQRPFKQALLAEVVELKLELYTIEGTLHSIENSLQKNNDKKI